MRFVDSTLCQRFVTESVAMWLLLIQLPQAVLSQYILFDATTDTIALSGQTNLSSSVTYEAQVLFSNAHQGEGNVFNEHTFAQEDKMFRFGPNQLLGFSFPAGGPGVLSLPATVSLNEWHHIAYVFDGSSDRIYLDGSLVGSRTAVGVIANSSGTPFLGAIFRDSVMVNSFLGYLDSFRMSNNVRYTGTSFTPPTGDFTNDANSIMLFNFNETSGSTILNDLSGNSYHGQLGVGFGGATSPEFVTAVPEPSTCALVLVIITFVSIHMFRKSRLSLSTNSDNL